MWFNEPCNIAAHGWLLLFLCQSLSVFVTKTLTFTQRWVRRYSVGSRQFLTDVRFSDGGIKYAISLWTQLHLRSTCHQMSLKLRLACVNVRHPPSKTPVGVCPGHAGVNWNDWADRPAGTTNSPWLASRKIWSVEDLETPSAVTKPRTSHHRLPGGKHGNVRRSSLKGRERAIGNQTNIKTFKATLAKLLEDVVERISAFFSSGA